MSIEYYHSFPMLLWSYFYPSSNNRIYTIGGTNRIRNSTMITTTTFSSSLLSSSRHSNTIVPSSNETYHSVPLHDSTIDINTVTAISNTKSNGNDGIDQHPSRDNSSSRDDEIQQSQPNQAKPIDWIALLTELALTISMAIISSMILSFITRKLLKGIFTQQSSPSELDDNNSTSSETQIYKRLKHILIKRNHNMNTAVGTTKVLTAGKKEQQIVVIPTLSIREIQMADEIIDPDDIECNFTDIGGLDSMKQEIYELAIVPLIQPHLFSNKKSKLIQPMKGILLYGKPGTGKTMIAKALAKESCAIFLPLQLSKILNKYWGESNKLIAATFSLAHKLQPAVIFIDELDTFLKNSNSETAYMDSIKAEFLTLWDGISTSNTSRVLVLGATNKPQHIDPAILRRMPRAFEVPLPDTKGRLAILQLLLKDENIDDTVLPALPKLVDVTHGYSGSDLKELCKAAAMVSVQEHTAEFARRRVMGEPDSALDDALEQRIRPMTESDLIIGLNKVRRTGEAANKYGKKSDHDQHVNDGSTALDINALNNFAKLLQALSSQVSSDSKDNNNNSDDDMPNL